MDRRLFLISSAAALAFASGEGLASPPAADADAALDRFLTRDFEHRLDRSPEFVTSLGLDHGARAAAKSRLTDRSLAAWRRERREAITRERRLQAFHRDALSPSSRISLDIAVFRSAIAAEYARNIPFGDAGGYVEPYVVSQLTGAYQDVPDFLDNQHAIETDGDALAYLARVRQFAVALDQDTARLAHDAGQGAAAPDFALDAALTQLRALHDVAAADSSLVRSLARRAAAKGLSPQHAADAQRIFDAEVRPALARQIARVQQVRAGAAHDAGVWRLPHGEEIYRLALRNATTTTMTPEEVHELGLDQVAELTAQIEPLLAARGLTQGSIAERVQVLSIDPQHLFANTDEGRAQLLAYLNATMQDMRARLPQMFATLPAAPVEIRRVPPAIEEGAPNGYAQRPSLDGSRPGAYYINLKNTADWPRWSLKTLTYHETFPGHQLQGQVAQANAALPLYRRIGGNSAYNEGWALYAETLADEMGLYADDPLGRLGYLQSFLFRAVRLVVDTGMHAKRWSREQAIAYMIENTGRPSGAVQREIDRYCVWPGQACAYKIGQIAISRLRAEAQAALQGRFDIKGFHDAVLTQGAMPLTALESAVRAWAASVQG
jgi:uncharacterized protein (DUF885 family)